MSSWNTKCSLDDLACGAKDLRSIKPLREKAIAMNKNPLTKMEAGFLRCHIAACDAVETIKKHATLEGMTFEAMQKKFDEVDKPEHPNFKHLPWHKSYALNILIKYKNHYNDISDFVPLAECIQPWGISDGVFDIRKPRLYDLPLSFKDAAIFFKKHVAPYGKGNEAMKVPSNSADNVNKKLEGHALKQNNEKRDIVPRLWGQKQLENSQPSWPRSKRVRH